MFHTNKKRSHNILGRLNKRGQFTMFVILGMVIFAAFSFALYARAKIINSQMIIQADTQIKDYLNKNSINQYVTSCLDSVTEETILLASMQGGLLNSTDKILNQDYVEYNDTILRNRTFNVSIAVDTNEFCPDGSDVSSYIVTQQPEHYPYNCRNVYLDELPSIYNVYGTTSTCENACIDYEFLDYSGFFGINKLPILCNPVGGNAPRSGINTITCDYYDYYKKSMQQLLEEHIASKISDCVNFTKVISQTSSNITTVGDSRVRITFNKGSFSVRLQYPFTIILRNKQPVTRMVDFGIEKELPFKELYDYTYELANDDIKNVKFDVVNNKDTVLSQRRNIRLYNSYYIVSNFFGDSNNNYTDIIQVQDTAHKLRGIPLTMNIGVRNRRPALEFINENRSPQYDIVTSENKTITINPQGYDPDDEKVLTYSYGGWLEEWNDYYNLNDPLCNGDQATTLEYIMENCTISEPAPPYRYNWSQSQLFEDTGQNASYNTSREDMGFHIVKVIVSDRNGLIDFQNVRILIFDLPVARINVSNYYPELSQDWASREDLYLLKGSESTLGTLGEITGATFSNFLWTDNNVEPINVNKNIDPTNPTIESMNLRIPEDVNDVTGMDIRNIGSYAFRDDGPLGARDIQLTVTDSLGLSSTAIFPVQMHECLPHRNPANPSYPYNADPTSLQNALQADHSCCTDDGNYAGENAVCYNPIRYGMDISFDDYSQRPLSDPYPAIDTVYTNTPGYDNDILVQTFTRYCTNDRGNICTGIMSETRDVATQCDDTNNGLDNRFSQERCSGPSAEFFSSHSAVDTNPGCINYTTGTTFESLLAANGLPTIGTSTGLCTGNTKQHSADGITWDDNGMYLCDGTCDGNGGCVPTNCGCGAGGVNNPCDGIGIDNSGTGNLPGSCGAGSPYFQDTCNNCQVQDTNTCRYGVGDCWSASQYCNNKNPGAAATTNAGGRVCDASGTRWTICDDSCQLASESDICRSTGVGCNAAPQCNARLRNTVLPNPNQYCNVICQVSTCPPGQTYSNVQLTCI